MADFKLSGAVYATGWGALAIALAAQLDAEDPREECTHAIMRHTTPAYAREKDDYLPSWLSNWLLRFTAF